MDRAAAALSGTNSRAAQVRNPSTEVYHWSLATGLSTGMPRDVARLYAGRAVNSLEPPTSPKLC